MAIAKKVWLMVVAMGMMVSTHSWCAIEGNHEMSDARAMDEDGEGEQVKRVEYSPEATKLLFKAVTHLNDRDGITKIHEALEQNADMHAYDQCGSTPLNAILVRLGWNQRSINGDKFSRNTEDSAIAYLIENGADVHKASGRGNGLTPLTWAFIADASPLVKDLLIARGAVVNEEFFQQEQDEGWCERMLALYGDDIKLFIYDTWPEKRGLLQFKRSVAPTVFGNAAERVSKELKRIAEQVYEERDCQAAELDSLLPGIQPAQLVILISEYAGCGGMYSPLINRLEYDHIERKRLEHALPSYAARSVAERVLKKARTGVTSAVATVASAVSSWSPWQ